MCVIILSIRLLLCFVSWLSHNLDSLSSTFTRDDRISPTSLGGGRWIIELDFVRVFWLDLRPIGMTKDSSMESLLVDNEDGGVSIMWDSVIVVHVKMSNLDRERERVRLDTFEWCSSSSLSLMNTLKSLSSRQMYRRVRTDDKNRQQTSENDVSYSCVSARLSCVVMIVI